MSMVNETGLEERLARRVARGVLRGWGRRGAIGAAVVVSATCIAAQDPGQQVESTRSVLDKWVETRRVISKEKREWTEGRQTLQDRIDLVSQQIEAVRQKIADAETSIGESEGKKDELAAENARLEAASAVLVDLVAGMEERTRALLQRVPEPLRERVRPLSQRLPADSAATELSLSERFQNVVGILNECNKFDGDVTVASEVRTLPDGSATEVTALYVGLGQGYYVNAGGDVAGVGRAGKDRWEWTPANAAAPAIAEAIAILQNEKPAAFVRVPVQIESRGGKR